MLRATITLCCILLSTGVAHSDVGTKDFGFINCLDNKTPHELFISPNNISLRPSQTFALDEGFVFIHGSLGWHTTWGVLFDLSTNSPSAFETYGIKGDIVGAFGRMEVPEVISTALKECGFAWRGLWEDDWPDRDQKLFIPADIEPDITKLPASELVPPLE